jgi:hypothetical protein
MGRAGIGKAGPSCLGKQKEKAPSEQNGRRASVIWKALWIRLIYQHIPFFFPLT